MPNVSFITRATSITCRAAAVILLTLTVIRQTDLAAAQVCLRPRLTHVAIQRDCLRYRREPH